MAAAESPGFLPDPPAGRTACRCHTSTARSLPLPCRRTCLRPHLPAPSPCRFLRKGCSAISGVHRRSRRWVLVPRCALATWHPAARTPCPSSTLGSYRPPATSHVRLRLSALPGRHWLRCARVPASCLHFCRPVVLALPMSHRSSAWVRCPPASGPRVSSRLTVAIATGAGLGSSSLCPRLARSSNSAHPPSPSPCGNHLRGVLSWRAPAADSVQPGLRRSARSEASSAYPPSSSRKRFVTGYPRTSLIVRFGT